MQQKISLLARVAAALAAAMLAVAIFVPLWRIDLDAPQYPEGLMLLIYPNKLGGNVEIINGLNHYIGMQTLHASNFIEFTILPYIIAAYALLFLAVAIRGTKRLLYIAMAAFVIFGVVAMADFWRWEYNYGHNLDPNAAIIVPGMAYQPPLIGFKQLLNFGAYSMPDVGGWLFVAAGLLLFAVVAKEAGWLRRLLRRKAAVAMAALPLLGLMGCSNGKPEPLQLYVDKCTYCTMAIADSKLGAELLTDKGRAYKFDDLICMKQYCQANPIMQPRHFFVCDYAAANVLIDATKANYVVHESIKTPMQGHTAAFANREAADKLAKQLGVGVMDWAQVFKK